MGIAGRAEDAVGLKFEIRLIFGNEPGYAEHLATRDLTVFVKSPK